MSKQYMTITGAVKGETVTIKTNSERAIKTAIKKLEWHIGGDIKTVKINGNVIKFTYTNEPTNWGMWQPEYSGCVYIVENTFETAEVVEVEAPAAEVVEVAPAAEVVETTIAPIKLNVTEGKTKAERDAWWGEFMRDYARQARAEWSK